MHHSIMSGESFLIAADILHYAERGVRCFVVLQPFGCLPNHIAGRGIIKKVKEIHPEIMVLPLDYDPDSGFANIENRLQMMIMNARGMGKDRPNKPHDRSGGSLASARARPTLPPHEATARRNRV